MMGLCVNISFSIVVCIGRGGGEENMLHNLFGGRLFVTKCHGGGRGSKKWLKLCYVINEWRLRAKKELKV